MLILSRGAGDIYLYKGRGKSLYTALALEWEYIKSSYLVPKRIRRMIY
jgi:hypothetical protein